MAAEKERHSLLCRPDSSKGISRRTNECFYIGPGRQFVKLTVDARIGLVLLILSLVIIFVLIPTIPRDIFLSVRGEAQSRFFPMAIAIGMMVLSVILIIGSYLVPRVGDRPVSSARKKEIIRVGEAAVLAFVYVFLMYLLGYLIPTIVILGLLFWFSGERRWTVILPTAIGVSLAFYYFFGRILMLMMPRGLLFG